jgi:Membrane bound O-acyl transferase family
MPLFDRVPPWLFMWALAFAIFCACKGLTWWRASVPGASAWRHAGYLLAWPGLDAEAFLRPEPLPESERPRPREWMAAGTKLLAGAAIFWGARRLVPVDYEILLGWAGMIGLILMLHFGSFHLLSCAWRAAGVDAKPLMRRPLAAQSLSEFWGRRWNTAFRDLTHKFLFRPLAAGLGPRWALVAGFVFSGVVHDLVISLPARGGYGGPTLFFSLQGAGLLAERTRLGRAWGLGRGGRGWLFAMLALALPVGMLFHPPFVRRVFVPFMRVLGAA